MSFLLCISIYLLLMLMCICITFVFLKYLYLIYPSALSETTHSLCLIPLAAGWVRWTAVAVSHVQDPSHPDSPPAPHRITPHQQPVVLTKTASESGKIIFLLSSFCSHHLLRLLPLFPFILLSPCLLPSCPISYLPFYFVPLFLKLSLNEPTHTFALTAASFIVWTKRFPMFMDLIYSFPWTQIRYVRTSNRQNVQIFHKINVVPSSGSDPIMPKIVRYSILLSFVGLLEKSPIHKRGSGSIPERALTSSNNHHKSNPHHHQDGKWGTLILQKKRSSFTKYILSLLWCAKTVHVCKSTNTKK